jgi:hypothetical protein
MRGDDNDDLVPGCSGLGIAGEYMYRMLHLFNVRQCSLFSLTLFMRLF